MFNSVHKFKYFIFVLAAFISVLAAIAFSNFIEARSKKHLKSVLSQGGYSWAEIDTDGLRIFIHGNAPEESERVGAIRLVRSVVAPQRLIDNISSIESIETKQKAINLKILKSIGKVFVIGSFPEGSNALDFEARLKKRLSINEEYRIILNQTDLTPTVDWGLTTSYALSLVDVIEIGKIETDGKRLFLEGIVEENLNSKNLIENIKSRAPLNLPVEILFHQPRELISPFTFQIETKNGLLKYSNCVVADETSKIQIAELAKKLNATAMQECIVGLGEPSPQWTEALKKAFSISAQLVNAKVVFDNLDISIIFDHSFSQHEYDKIINSISNTFPSEFVLSLVKLSNNDSSDVASNKVVATLSPEGLLKIIGPISEGFDEELVVNFAKARFGSEHSSTSLYNGGSLPPDWGFRIIAGLEGLKELKNGILEVTPNLIEIRGTTYKKFSSAKITKLIGNKIGYNQRLSLEIDYVEMPKPKDNSLTASQCVAKISEVLKLRKIKFEPGSDRVDLAGQEILDDIAKILFNCGDIILEIGGHTDSQGREQMNLNLSQARANAVLFELQRRRILTKNIVAKGYGESEPVASNETEQGREKNRRIEFRHLDLSLGIRIPSENEISD